MKKTIKLCEICPNYCKIPLGDYGKCKVIKNHDGVLKNMFSGKCSNISVEPVEKRPLFHFHPNSKFLSVGFYGCSFFCDYCFNFKVSQQLGKGKYYSPSDLIDLALDRNVIGITFTYNEPTIFHEYIEDVGHLIQSKNLPLKIILKTNGYVNIPILRTLCLYIDAVNVDIKGDEHDYISVCGADGFDAAISSIELISKMGIHVEISYLVLPSKIHNIDFNKSLCDRIFSIDPNIPVHLLYFYPFYRMDTQYYSPKDLVVLHDLFSNKLNYVYISNRYDEELSKYRNTLCSLCNSVVIDRNKTSLYSTSCCKKSIYGIF